MELTESDSSKPLITQESSSEIKLGSVWSLNKTVSKTGLTAANERSSTSLCDLTKISDEELQVNRTDSPWRSREMPLLRRHSSASQDTDGRLEEQAHFSGMSRAINSSSSPPRLERVAVPVSTDIHARPVQADSSGGRGEPSRSHKDSFIARFPSHPPVLVRHSASYPEVNVSRKSLQNGTFNPGGSDSNRQQSSPFGDLTSSKHESAQSLQERNYVGAISVPDPLVQARHSPLFMSYQDKCKSTYVFSNRATFSQTENVPRPVQVSSLVMTNKNSVNIASNRSEVNSMHFQSIHDGFSLSNERQPSCTMQSQYARPTSFIHGSHNKLSSGTNVDVISANRQFNNSPVGFKRIPSPRSDLFSGFSPNLVNTAGISHVNIPTRGSLPSGNQPITLRQKGNVIDSLPPTWSHLEPPHSLLSAASRNTPPKPYTFSVNFSQSSRHYGTNSVSHFTSKTATTEEYSVRALTASDGQHVSVIQRASLGQREPLNVIQRELRVDEQENFRAYHLPKAFQEADARPESSSNALLNDFASERENVQARQPYLQDHSAGNLIRDTSSPLPQHMLPGLKPSSDSPSLKGRKDKVLDSNVAESTAFMSSSSPKNGKKTLGSKRKDTICPSLEKANDSPVFHPSEEEFQDPVAYIKTIRRDAEKFGVCVIVPPESWKVCFSLTSIFTTEFLIQEYSNERQNSRSVGWSV